MFQKNRMRPIVYNIYIVMMLMAYVMRRAGTFTMEEKVKMLEFIGTIARSPESLAPLQSWLSDHNHVQHIAQKSHQIL